MYHVNNKSRAAIGVCAATLLALGLGSAAQAATPAKKQTATSTAIATSGGIASLTNKGKTPNGKPFRYIQSQIASLQSQIDALVGRVSSLEERMAASEAAIDYLKQQNVSLQAQIDAHTADIAKLQQKIDANTALIALLQAQIDQINQTLATKQDIINQVCPAGQSVVGIQPAEGLICRAVVGGLVQTTVQKTYTVAPGATLDAVADCPAGTVPTGGSFDAVPGLVIVDSGSTATGFHVNATNTGTAELPLNVFTNCLGIQQ